MFTRDFITFAISSQYILSPRIGLQNKFKNANVIKRNSKSWAKVALYWYSKDFEFVF